ncbi:MAG: RnfABCDGE type electron transport complex subunit D [Gemmatimonadetes bacterium]|nr:RnfABCDGE type electron transport complex subunit D [Gemmatimonadota bacterium]
MNVRRFFRTPKGLLIIILSVLTGIAAIGEGLALVAPGFCGAIAAAMLLDAPLLRWRHKRWVFPDGALITGMIVAAILSPHEPWYIAAVTAGVGVVSKYLFRVGKANIFNPAAFGLVATFYVFDSGQSWWGALPEMATPWLLLLVATGAFITWKVNKAPIVLGFLGSYYLLITLTAFAVNPAHVAELYRAPDLHAALYFALFMVTDPPTSPPRDRDQLIYGTGIGVVAYAAFMWIGAAYWLLAGMLVANALDTFRRVRRRPLTA